ncbi:NAD(P)H-hydrate dehydratase [Helicobacter brantae]|uniref:Bifunctional NAD(P)H-hydrate repair enzyme n=1 Tax=Helicobacter brantae TaxID=375927 RepID=A0A3D8J355_9HELI|nr:NAD(P)H-hydrate dehydratase [Helicobacter brantae]RDU71843.1 bifunctional ADP-dependent NAD(P)H-hydrate dehydratase/NAD(P)H-hydrate epimerase [Helicobacter brantae]
MQNIYKETGVLDKRAIERYFLSEEILCENASIALKELLSKITHKKSLVYIICGGGNNGADGLALARKISSDYLLKVYMADEPKTPLAKQEYLRCKSAGVEFVRKIYKCDVLIDCLFGSGFRGEISPQTRELIEAMNQSGRKKIACDMPSGVGRFFKGVAFRADYTLCMGALKLDLFSEWAKDYVGEILTAPLGISKENYEIPSNIKLLEAKDLSLPYRSKQDTHKGEYGTLNILTTENEGSKGGASVLSALSSIAFGVGKVSIVGGREVLPYEVMRSEEIGSSVVLFGMGAGVVGEREFSKLHSKTCVLDADVFYSQALKDFLAQNSELVLTPHIKEFASLLRICGIADLSVEEVKAKRDELLLEFCSLYPEVVVVLKGANTLIAKGSKLYICTLGSNNLAKGGSGDILAGMIGSLLAQGEDRLKASTNAILAHALASQKIKTSYGLNPMDLIEAVKYL